MGYDIRSETVIVRFIESIVRMEIRRAENEMVAVGLESGLFRCFFFLYFHQHAFNPSLVPRSVSLLDTRLPSSCLLAVSSPPSHWPPPLPMPSSPSPPPAQTTGGVRLEIPSSLYPLTCFFFSPPVAQSVNTLAWTCNTAPSTESAFTVVLVSLPCFPCVNVRLRVD